jgi:hypothetical protein
MRTTCAVCLVWTLVSTSAPGLLSGCETDDAAADASGVSKRRASERGDAGADAAAADDTGDDKARDDRDDARESRPDASDDARDAEAARDDDAPQKDKPAEKPDDPAQPSSGAPAQPKPDDPAQPKPDAEDEPVAKDPALQGVLWATIDFCAGDNEYGVSKLSLADDKILLVEPDLSDLYPSATGRWYAYSSYNKNANNTAVVSTRLSVVSPEPLEVLHEATLPDAVMFPTPHPRESHLVLAVLIPDLANPESFVVVDLEKGEIVLRLPPTGGVDWTPDGKLMRWMSDGTRSLLTLDGGEEALASFELPTGYSPSLGFSISPDNQQMVVHMRRFANDAWSDDLWIGSMAGGALERLTRTTMTSYAVWSPDSRYIAFNRDRDIHAKCSPTSFSPERWHADARVGYIEASARDVTFEEARPFQLLGTGKRRVIAWTPE